MQPVDKELHFVISEVEYDDEGGVLTCSIEAVMSKRQSPIQWQDLKDATRWAQGWQ